MSNDSYKATWVSHSSLSDYLACPRAYFLKNVYKDPKTGHKIQIVSPALSLGSAVHEVLESLAKLPVEERFKTSLIEKYNQIWDKKYTGKQGGFSSPDQEHDYRARGEEMLRRVMRSPGPLAEKAVRIKPQNDMDLPQYNLSETENIILCGKIDWLRYDPDTNSVEIIDFKTSRSAEAPSSLQLPIYRLLVEHTQKYAVSGMSYWYLEFNDDLTPHDLPDLDAAEKEILALARKMKLARSLRKFDCPNGADGCPHCRQFERILAGEGEFLGTDETRRDLYYLPWRPATSSSSSNSAAEEDFETEEIL